MKSNQASLFPELDPAVFSEGTSGTFADNTRLPVHRWFRYSAGFSGAWAETLISREAEKRQICVFDPFVGSGTTLIASEQCGVRSWGIESHPFIARVTRGKLAYRSSAEKFLDRARSVLASARRRTPDIESYEPLIRKCYTDGALAQLDCLRREVECQYEDSEASLLAWLTLAAILRPTSHVGTANWQYLLPSRRKARVQEPFAAYEIMTNTMVHDMREANGIDAPRARFDVDDARLCEKIPDDSVNLIVTSPPYPNNYDYADATRLELTFFGEISGWATCKVKSASTFYGPVVNMFQIGRWTSAACSPVRSWSRFAMS